MDKLIAGVVVLYNPEQKVIDNILSYSSNVQLLYVVDNSEFPYQSLLIELRKLVPNIEYIHLPNNQGIAKALNIAAEKAIKDGFEWILTMDQDSRADYYMVQELLHTVSTNNPEHVGIVAPQHVLPSSNLKIGFKLEEPTIVITSGNLLNLQTFKKVGLFREDFFIDYVDHEYCLRLRLNGYKIIQNNEAILYHHLGDTKLYKFLGKTISSTNHNFIRRYYITRNRLATVKAYHNNFPEYCKSELKTLVMEVIKIILVEEDRLRKLKSIIEGYIDYKKGKFGKYTT